MQTTLTRTQEAAAAAPVAASPTGLIWRIRRQFLAVDALLGGFLLVLILWSLLAQALPWLRLYPYDPQFQWAELPAGAMTARLSLFLGVYLLAQRFGVRFHRDHYTTGKPAPIWLWLANLVYVLLPLLLVPLTFNMLGAFMAGTSGVPGVQTHPAFDPAQHYDRAATYWDLALKQADISVCGGYWPAQARALQQPWFTGLLMMCYVGYYISPLVVIVPPILRRRWTEVRRVAAVFAGTLLLTYVGYILIPATGPRFEGTFAAWLPAEPGWFGQMWWAHTLDEAEVIRWDAFPSGHTAVSLIAVLLSMRHERKVGLAYLPCVLGLIVATVVLGYHYVTDVVFGIACAVAGMLLVAPAARWWESVWPPRPGDAAREQSQ
ncbi:MAG: phosphatase PAP2 family protein [Planctomycetes bacterium]|nr:phosphatase PAP2 family protein [Planctomycetota bacterium]